MADSTSHEDFRPDRAQELADRAAREADPGHRVFFLQWAKAFQQLKVLGKDRTPAIDERD